MLALRLDLLTVSQTEDKLSVQCRGQRHQTDDHRREDASEIRNCRNKVLFAVKTRRLTLIDSNAGTCRDSRMVKELRLSFMVYCLGILSPAFTALSEAEW